MDFKKIISSTQNYNFHSHTQFCDGRADMETMARAAVACGMEHYGFSPHSPLIIPSPCNMDASAVDDYLAEVRRISAIDSLSSCRFYASMEIDYINNEWGPANSYFRSLPLDYRIGSVHFIPSQDGEYIDIDGRFERFRANMEQNFRGDIDYVVEAFYRQSMDMVRAGGFDILGHFDKIGQNASAYAPGIEEGSHYCSLVGQLIDMIIERRLTIELNTKARSEHGRFFPGERYLSRLVGAGIDILVNSDAHYPDRISASRDEAFAILDGIYATA